MKAFAAKTATPLDVTKATAATKATKATKAAKATTATKATKAAKATTDAGAPIVVLYPGAGTAADHPSLVALEDMLVNGITGHRVVGDVAPIAGVTVRRVDFAYRARGRKAPDRALVLVEEVRALADSLREDHPDRLIVFGGRSMGGRMCTMVAAAESAEIANGSRKRRSIDALACICYPLHPPGKPESLRVDHFPDMRLPILFVSGTKDAFGTPEELGAHTKAIPGAVEHRWIEGKGHDLKGADIAVAAFVAEWIRAEWIRTPKDPGVPRAATRMP